MSICDYCGRFFVDFDNIGTWKCRRHPLPYDAVLDMYPCCGRRIPDVPTNDLGRLQFNWKPLPPAPRVCGCVRCDCGDVDMEPIPLVDIVQMIDLDAEDKDQVIQEIMSRPGFSKSDGCIYRRESKHS